MKITYDLIKSLNPCYNPEEIGITHNYEATIPEFINEYRGKVKSKDDIQWVLLRPEFMSDRDLRLFAVWSAKQVQHLITDQRSIDALDIAEKFANGLATKEELAAARDAAWDAARDAARDAAWVAAWGAARDAQVDKLLAFFTAKENNQPFDWSV